MFQMKFLRTSCEGNSMAMEAGILEPYVFGHSVLLLIAQWGCFRIPLSVRVLDPKIRGHQNLLTREMLQKFKPPVWARQVIIEADAGFAAKKTLHLISELDYFYMSSPCRAP